MKIISRVVVHLISAITVVVVVLNSPLLLPLYGRIRFYSQGSLSLAPQVEPIGIGGWVPLFHSALELHNAKSHKSLGRLCLGRAGMAALDCW
ncbi:uncharacterized protein UV8b_04009 [Ustilaginoidea virens]|uniref:Uncharacterized protein n=1 Tax=Ustilaginoidea virens TaxID=1159556 RepID=A0A8E5HQT4_USTVR|nr:uncharacterized protein UV8b_04009 [Ustilaginoidea virens]QUC19768.1 hypothetical protein UV8b_04009 [Ustilaginoidea virens]